MTIGNWERNVYPPARRFTARIIDWLGYDPKPPVWLKRT